jgi:predicted flap endonuclease-1-like 5' DNA nuclease
VVVVCAPKDFAGSCPTFLLHNSHLLQKKKTMLRRFLPVTSRKQVWFLSTTTTTTTKLDSSTSGPRAKHRLNIDKAVKKSNERQSFQYLTKQPIEILQGIGPKHAEELHSLNLKTIEQLADYKFFKLARSIATLAKVEEADGRLENTLMNLDKGLDKGNEEKSFKELLNQPVHVLQGISPRAGETLASLGVKTVMDLATFKYCEWAEAIVVAARFEDQ